MKFEKCARCWQVAVRTGLPYVFACDQCEAKWAEYCRKFCAYHPSGYEGLKPGHLSLVDWLQVMLGGGTCEPRRWPSPWEYRCGPVHKPIKNRKIWHKPPGATGCARNHFGPNTRTNKLPGRWGHMFYTGFCRPGVGPVCEVGA